MRIFLERFCDTHKSPRPQGATRSAGGLRAIKSGYLDLLPPELVQQIAVLLPPSSAASLTLCNHTLMYILGTQHLQRVSLRRSVLATRDPVAIEEGVLFFRGLVRDRPAASSFYCYHCHKIHHLPLKKRRTVCRETRVVEYLWASNSSRLFDRVRQSLCQKGRSVYNHDPNSHAKTWVVYHNGFVFEHVQIAMELHRQGSSHLLNAYLDRLSLKNKDVVAMSYWERYKGFHFFEPRIVDHQMIVRAQSWVVMPLNDRLSIHRQFQLPDNLRNMTVCAHLDTRWRQENLLTGTLRCRLEHARYQTSSSCVNCVGNLRCPMCPTEIQVDIKPFADKKSKSRGVMLVVTRWQLIGDGHSPFERHWAHRLREQCDPWPWHEGASMAEIKTAYEACPGIKCDSILNAEEALKLMRRSQR